jgi:lantibiotic modifying enzyme
VSELGSVALAIGRRLAKQATWHDGRCNWLAPVPVQDGRPSLALRSLQADLYEGTSGVALVLAELAHATGDELCRRTALGSARHALTHIGSVEPAQRAGFYAGRPGIVLALSRIGQLLASDEMTTGARTMALDLEREVIGAPSVDLVGGHAGAIVAMLALDVAADTPALRDAATRLGDGLAALAARHGTWSWTTPDPATRLDPTGLAHGASGIALAMMALADATGASRFALAASQAIDAENAWRDPDTTNWLEPPTSPPRGTSEVRRSFIAWCHGAPGIGLVRHRAWMVTGDHRRLDEARDAAALTASWLRAALETGRGDFSLCHGLTGVAEILRDLPPTNQAGRALPDAVAQHGIDEHVRDGKPFPCGGPGGESPGLMLGLAGIAHFYLRASGWTCPSLLSPWFKDWVWPGGPFSRAPGRQAAAPGVDDQALGGVATSG